MSVTGDFIIENGVLTAYTADEKTVLVPDGVTRIAARAFYGKIYMEKVELSDSVRQIDAFAFDHCWSLHTIGISRGVRYIGTPITDSCPGMQRILVDPENTAYCSVGSVLCSRDEKALIRAPEGLDAIAYYIPDGVERIAPFAFYRCHLLQCADMSDRVRRIGRSAFGFCVSLKRIFLSEQLRTIEPDTFVCCCKLREITLPDAVGQIGQTAFHGCTALQTVHYDGTPGTRAAIHVQRGNAQLLRAEWVRTGE